MSLTLQDFAKAVPDESVKAVVDVLIEYNKNVEEFGKMINQEAAKPIYTKEYIDQLTKKIEEMEKENIGLCVKIGKAVKALEFYGNKEQWKENSSTEGHGGFSARFSLLSDHGALARETLAEINKGLLK